MTVLSMTSYRVEGHRLLMIQTKMHHNMDHCTLVTRANQQLQIDNCVDRSTIEPGDMEVEIDPEPWLRTAACIQDRNCDCVVTPARLNQEVSSQNTAGKNRLDATAEGAFPAADTTIEVPRTTSGFLLHFKGLGNLRSSLNGPGVEHELPHCVFRDSCHTPGLYWLLVGFQSGP